MAKVPKEVADPRFHRKLFGALSDYSETLPPCLTYVENGNYNSGYDLLADDYKMAADSMIQEYERTGFGNWSAPVTFMVRQTLELSHKSLLEETGRAGNSVSPRVIFSHDLEMIWAASRDWLLANNYPIQNDQRFIIAEWTTTNFHAVDPSGDLFRFAHSRVAAYGRHKTYDRAGVALNLLVPYFEKTYSFLSHWDSLLATQRNREEMIAENEEWEPFWDPDDYPKIAATAWRWWPK